MTAAQQQLASDLEIRKAGDADRFVLILIGGGIVLIILAIIAAVAFVGKDLHDMAETIFGAIVGGALVKLADVLSTLVALQSSRQVAKMSEQLSGSAPAPADPKKTTVEE
jgi:hypothetical protein